MKGIHLEIERLIPLVKNLTTLSSIDEKIEMLSSLDEVKNFMINQHGFLQQLNALSLNTSMHQLVVLSLAAVKQFSIVFQGVDLESIQDSFKINKLLQHLLEIEEFYSSMGGIVGYHSRILIQIAGKSKSITTTQRFFQAHGNDISRPDTHTREAIIAGLKHLKEMAEIYPIGGLGDRLNLTNECQEPLPAACLQFLGRSLLEGLIRDVQAREYLYYKIFNERIYVPIAMMTSFEKNNHQHIVSICQNNHWFGRPQEMFCFFSQLSVPVVTIEGNWSMLAPGELNVKPGGHGVLWKLAQEKGVFVWLTKMGKSRILVRQINNPIASIDYGLTAFVGVGCLQQKSFGLSSCQRLVQAAEGVLVLAEKKEQDEKYGYAISNIEYTDFERYGIEDVPGTTCLKSGNEYSLYPANTNILYADLARMAPFFAKSSFPGMMINMKTKAPYHCPSGQSYQIEAGRLETMMQNISDEIVDVHDEKKDPSYQHNHVYLTYNERKKTISTTKKSYEKGKHLLETPEGAFIDYLSNGYDLLKDHCNMSIPPMPASEEYIVKGPSFLFYYHPALGPFYDIIAQKILGGSMTHGSELQLEIAELELNNVEIDGSLLIFAEHVMGHLEQQKIVYGEQTGKCSLKNVRVSNLGIDFQANYCFWKNDMERKEVLKIELLGNGEFFAENVYFEGSIHFQVPDGWRWTVTANEQGEWSILKEKIYRQNWHWHYFVSEDNKYQIKKIETQLAT